MGSVIYDIYALFLRSCTINKNANFWGYPCFLSSKSHFNLTMTKKSVSLVSYQYVFTSVYCLVLIVWLCNGVKWHHFQCYRMSLNFRCFVLWNPWINGWSARKRCERDVLDFLDTHGFVLLSIQNRCFFNHWIYCRFHTFCRSILASKIVHINT